LSAPALAAALLGSLLGSPARAAEAGVPVEIGGEADLDACDANARVALTDPAGSLNLRLGPGLDHSVILGLRDGQDVIVCGESPDGGWLGVVVSTDGRPCGLGSPVAARQPYAGPCPSGWVKRAYLRP
jgi:hypothetical protein